MCAAFLVVSGGLSAAFPIVAAEGPVSIAADSEGRNDPEVPSLVKIQEHVKALSSLGSRIPGSPGHELARKYVLDFLTNELGLRAYETPQSPAEPSFQPLTVYRQRYWGTAPVDNPGEGRLTVRELATEGSPLAGVRAELGTFPLYGLWPNDVALPRTAAAGLSGAFIYAGEGRPQDFNGLPVLREVLVLRSGQRIECRRVEERMQEERGERKEIYAAETDEGWKTFPREDVLEYERRGAIVLLEVAAETSWSVAATLGAAAAVFIEPETALRPDLEKLYTTTPVEFPRFWLSRADGLRLRKEIQVRQTEKKAPLEAVAVNRMEWKNDIWENLCVLIPGTGNFIPKLTANNETQLRAKERKLREATVILSAHYDSCSVVPGLAPGAEQALSCAFLMELARLFKERPPAYDLLIVFATGHYQGLKGTREFFGDSVFWHGRNEAEEFAALLRAEEKLRGSEADLKREFALLEKLENIFPALLADGKPPEREELLSGLRPVQSEFGAAPVFEATLNRIVKRVKDKAYALEDQKRRQARLQKLLGRPKEEWQAGEALADEDMDCALFLYSLTKEGAGLKVKGVSVETLRNIRAAIAGVRGDIEGDLRYVELELARRLDNHPLGRELRARLAPSNGRNAMFFALDLSAGAPALTWLCQGALYNLAAEKIFSDFFRTAVGRVAGDLLKTHGVARPDAVFPPTVGGRRNWQTYFPTIPAHAAEVALQSMIRGLTLITPYDQRLSWDTPQDRLDDASAQTQEKWRNVGWQASFVGPYLFRLLAHQDTAFTEAPRKLANTGLTKLNVCAVRRGGAQSIFPDVPVFNALVAVNPRAKSAAGVRMCFRETVRCGAGADFVGVKHNTRMAVEAFGVDAETGEIRMALNKVKNGLRSNVNADFITRVDRATRNEVLELVPCRGMAFLDLMDPRQLSRLPMATLLQGRTEAAPLEFSSVISPGEPHAVMFAEPGTRIKVLFRQGEIGLRLAVLGVTEDTVTRLLNPAVAAGVRMEDARGLGLRVGSRKIADLLPMRAAMDLWCLDEHRLNDLGRRNISNLRIRNPHFDPNIANALEGEEKPGLHDRSRLALESSRQKMREGNLGAAWEQALAAWALEQRAYPDVLGTANDSVHGIVFYLFLLLPFCWFLERLLFAFPKIERQIAAFFGLFILFFVLLWTVHPAFDLVASPPIILLAFVIVTLSGIVIAIIYGKFNAEMDRLRQGGDEETAVQGMDVHRAGAVTAAFMLGINQMRRRRMRTFLTCVTVVLLTFAALSFTSVVHSTADAVISLSDTPDAPYSGILLCNLNYGALPESAAPILREMLSANPATRDIYPAPRYWKTTRPLGAGQYLEYRADLLVTDPALPTTASPAQSTRIVSPAALLGLARHEADIFPLLARSTSDPSGGMLVAGEWLPAGEDGREVEDVCLLPETLLGADNDRKLPFDDPQEAIGKTVSLGGYALRIVGIFDPRKISNIRDLDGEEITPVNFEMSDKSGAGAVDEHNVESLKTAANVRRMHVDPESLVILPWRTAARMGASLHTVAVRLEDATALGGKRAEGAAEGLVERLTERLDKNLFVGLGGHRLLYTQTGRMNVAGLTNLLVPLIIAVLILLNTMVGAVYERGREIAIFNSLGLAPSHVAMLFLAEALVYAVLGAIFGYLLGQFTSWLVQLVGIEGLYLNYSSSSAVFVTAVVMIAVILSTLYPARMAAKAAAPSDDRSWVVPVPVNDEIRLELPFSFQKSLVPGVALFLHDFFIRHEESTVGKFTARNIRLETYHTNNGPAVCLTFMTWLTPYDLGVSQETKLRIEPFAEELYVTSAAFRRVSGYVDSWRRINYVFLNDLRRQFLAWRTFTSPQRARFARRGAERFPKEFSAEHWPVPAVSAEPQQEEERREESTSANTEPAVG